MQFPGKNLPNLLLAFVMLVSVSAVAQDPDETGNREHYFPLVVDGDGFRTHLFLHNASNTVNNCTLELNESRLNADRFEASDALSTAGGRLDINLAEANASLTLSTTGEQALNYGHAKLDCADPVVARMMLNLAPNGLPFTMATLESVTPDNLFQFPVLPRFGRLALFLSSFSRSDSVCDVELSNIAGTNLGMTEISVQAGSTALRFLDDIFSVPNGFDTGKAMVRCRQQEVSVTGISISGSNFSAFPAINLESEKSKSSHILPLIVDGDGFRSQLLLTNLSDSNNPCSIDLRGDGLNANRFAIPENATAAASGIVVELDGKGDLAAMLSAGEQSLALGYATVECEGAVAARNFLSLGVSGNFAGMSTISSAQRSDTMRFPIIPEFGNLAVVNSNDSEIAVSCTTKIGENLNNRVVPPHATDVQIFRDLPSNNTVNAELTIDCDNEVAFLLLPYSGTIFSATPPILDIDTAPTFKEESSAGNRSYVQSIPISQIRLPEAKGGNGDLIYSLSQDVPGLIFNDAARLLGGTPEEAGTYTLTYTATDEDGDQSSFEFTIAVQPFDGNAEVEIPDEDLRSLIAAVLGRSSSARITVNDMSTIRRLWSGHNIIKSLEGLQYATELVYLELGRRQIADISPISGLKNLLYLNLYANPLHESEFSEFWQLVNLRYLNISFSQLGGTIPPELGQLVNLESLLLRGNQLGGAVPPELGQLSSLKLMDFGENNLSGPIPSELGQLVNLESLFLDGNQLGGAVPPELGQLSSLKLMDFGENNLSGPIPSELGQLSSLEIMDFSYNSLSGPIPSDLWQLSSLREMNFWFNPIFAEIPWGLKEPLLYADLHYKSIASENLAISGFFSGRGAPPNPIQNQSYSENPNENGNASYHSIRYFQGPRILEQEFGGDIFEYSPPILGRRAMLAVTILHEVPEPPLVITRVVDSDNQVLDESLGMAAVPTTESVGNGSWRTEYYFDMPGEFFVDGNKIEHVIDPENGMAETNEEDNSWEPLIVYGETLPKLRISFIPIQFPGEENARYESISSGAIPFLMRSILAYLPIADDYEARIGSILRVGKVMDTFTALHEVYKLWNLEADPDEYYIGINDNFGGGVAFRSSFTATSSIIPSTIAHEFGHNLALLHPPGCNAENTDENYPYPRGGLGPTVGWDANWRRIASAAELFDDVMSYCTVANFISDYHYRKAFEYRRALKSRFGASMDTTSAVTTLAEAGAENQAVDGNFAPMSSATASDAESSGSLALAGRIGADSVWSLDQAALSLRDPRPPPLPGEHTLVLYDGAGVQLYSEPLAVTHIHTHLRGDDESFWAARTPLPLRAAREIIIFDSRGNEMLRRNLPELE